MITLFRAFNRNEPQLAVLKLMTAALLMLTEASAQLPLTTTQIAKRVSPSVVAIHGKTMAGDVVGSGFIVSKDGKIVTNLHVIKDLTAATVQLANGEIFDSISILATDERRDLAIIHVAGYDLQPLSMGNSNAVVVGESVVVVGSPRGLEGTVTAGILSAVRDTGDGYKVLQTDASVNPGNSGGPLANSNGQVIGVVSFKLRSSQGLNFAIPINYVAGLLNEPHDPISLEQMRKSLNAKAATEQSGASPSLSETLDWLKEKIPLAANHYVTVVDPQVDGPSATLALALFGKWKDVSETTIPIRFESCSVTYEVKDVTIFEKFRELPETTTTRVTVPLGAVNKVEVTKDSSSIHESLSKSKNVEEWIVTLATTPSKTVLVETHETVHNTTNTESTDLTILIFYEESIAQKVSEAFKHAAELCRGREPF
jgi:S1-C subfamily serine protease